MPVIVPVSQVAVDDPVFRRERKIVNIALHAFIARIERLPVAVPLVQVPRDEHAGYPPFGSFVPVSVRGDPHEIVGAVCRNMTVGELRVPYIARDLVVPAPDVVPVAYRPGHMPVLFLPAVLLPVRAIGCNVAHVRTDRPVDQTVSPVLHIAGAGECPDDRTIGSCVYEFKRPYHREL